MLFFPFQVGIGIFGWSNRLYDCAVDKYRRTECVAQVRLIRVGRLYTCNPVACSKFKVAQPSEVFHELFLRYAPCSGCGIEQSPTVVFTELA